MTGIAEQWLLCERKEQRERRKIGMGNHKTL